ncbi:MAG TPA: hypothetical protein VN549_04940 [Negativicutes bacterium]|nr:hypothetical protein [Negativicutes bacterium]
MNNKYKSFIKGFIVMIITVTCLYAGQALWQNYAVGQPLDRALKGIDGVAKVSWNKGSNINDAISIDVDLKKTDNLKKTYDEIYTKIEETLKGKQFVLKLGDNRTAELEQAYYDINYYIQKAVMDGDFPLLEEKAQNIAILIGSKAKVYVDEQNVYLQLNKDEHSLFSVTARNPEKIGGSFQ